MKVREQVWIKVEIGPLDHALRLETSGRKRLGMKTPCSKCGKPIEEDHFVGGFKKGHRNLLLHEDCCDEHTKSLISLPD